GEHRRLLVGDWPHIALRTSGDAERALGRAGWRPRARHHAHDTRDAIAGRARPRWPHTESLTARAVAARLRRSADDGVVGARPARAPRHGHASVAAHTARGQPRRGLRGV